MKRGFVLLAVAIVAIALTASAPALAQGRGTTFTPVGFIENPGNFPASSVMSMNPAGTVFYVTPNWTLGGYAVIWTRAGGWGQHVGSVDNYPKVSAQGTLMVGGIYPNSSPAYTWPGTWMGVQDQFEPIPPNPDYAPCGSSRMSFYDMGGNGDYACGLTWSGCSAARGFLWSKDTNTTINLGSPNGQSTRANAVSDDGKTVIGWGTALFGSRRGATWKNGTWVFNGDPAGLEPKACSQTGKACTANSADPVRGCPVEYVDDASCYNKGVCTAGVCVGGYDAGKTCTSSSACGGTCGGGPNNGKRCTSNSSCPDTPVCLTNPLWNDNLWKGEAYVMTPDAKYVAGQNFDYNLHWTDGYRMNPDGTFTMIPYFPDFPYNIVPMAISDKGRVVGGFAGGQLFGYMPFIWTELTGTMDFQAFLIGQGLDDLYFWYLMRVHALSADGLIVGGVGGDPDGWTQGFVVDMHRVLVCHNDSAAPGGSRTVNVSFDLLGDYLRNGDSIGSCEFLHSGGLARVAALREQNLAKWRAGAWKTGNKVINMKNAPVETIDARFQELPH